MSIEEKELVKKAEILYEFDDTLDQKYKEVLDDIKFIRADIHREERKARKKAYKRMRKGNRFYDTRGQYNVRRAAIRRMEEKDKEGLSFIDKVLDIFVELKPICVIIAKLVMSLIVSILSIDVVKYRIGDNALNRIHQVYVAAEAVAGVG